jgi:protein disulfide-isomerase
MSPPAVRRLLLFAMLATPQLAAAADAAKITWHADVNQAWQTAQQQNRPLLVFVTADNCLYCTKMKQSTLVDPAIAANVNRSCVALVLDAKDNSPLLKELAVKSYPMTFLISPQAVVLARIEGYVPAQALRTKLAQVNQRPTAVAVAKTQ